MDQDMNSGEHTGVFLALNDCVALYPRLKSNEFFLSDGERMVLIRIEKALYECFSIKEMEELLDRGAARADMPGRV